MASAANRPNLFILGAAKAGTTTLYHILNQHPQVYMSFDKEPAFFCDDEYYARGEGWYLRTFFQKAGDFPVRGEATSRYLYFGQKVAPRIHKFAQSSSPKFIAIFRDPAQLVHSFYWNSVREGHESLPIEEALNMEQSRMAEQRQDLEARGQILFAYSQIACYARQLQEFLNYFEKKDILCFITEDLANSAHITQQLQTFLEIDAFPTVLDTAKNTAALPKNKRLHHWLRKSSTVKDLLKPLIPYTVRYNIKNRVLEKNLKPFQPPTLDRALANAIRSQYFASTQKLEELIDRDLSEWYPT